MGNSPGFNFPNWPARKVLHTWWHNFWLWWPLEHFKHVNWPTNCWHLNDVMATALCPLAKTGEQFLNWCISHEDADGVGFAFWISRFLDLWILGSICMRRRTKRRWVANISSSGIGIIRSLCRDNWQGDSVLRFAANLTTKVFNRISILPDTFRPSHTHTHT